MIVSAFKKLTVHLTKVSTRSKFDGKRSLDHPQKRGGLDSWSVYGRRLACDDVHGRMQLGFGLSCFNHYSSSSYCSCVVFRESKPLSGTGWTHACSQHGSSHDFDMRGTFDCNCSDNSANPRMDAKGVGHHGPCGDSETTECKTDITSSSLIRSIGILGFNECLFP